MERYEVQSNDYAILPQGEFVELASVIEVIDVTEQNVVWNLHDDLEGDYVIPTYAFATTKEDTLQERDIEKETNSSEENGNFAPHKEFGYFNTGFIALLTLLIYPVLLAGTNIWNVASDTPAFKETGKLFSAILRA